MATIHILLPRESHGQRSLAGYSPKGHKESDTTEHTHMRLNLCLFHRSSKGGHFRVLVFIIKHHATVNNLVHLVFHNYRAIRIR